MDHNKRLVNDNFCEVRYRASNHLVGMDFIPGKPGAPAPVPFSVVLAYDAPPAAEHVGRVYDFLAQQFHDRLDFQCTQCQFEQLKHPGFAGEATDVAAEADLVIIGTMDGRQLPTEVVSWVEGWIARNGGANMALIGSVKSEEQNTSQTTVHRYLQATATDGGIAFFPGCF